MKLNQATAAAAAFLFATLASSSLATSSHEELEDKIAPPLASKPDHYLRSHRMLQSSYDFPTTSSGSGSNCSTGSPCYAAARTAFPVGKALLGLLGLIPIACGAAARRKTEEEEEAAVEPAAEEAAAPEAAARAV